GPIRSTSTRPPVAAAGRRHEPVRSRRGGRPVTEPKESVMDATVDQAGFARALRLIGRAVPSRPTLPILQHVLLEGGSGRLTMTATDLDLAVITSTPADVAEAGRVLLPARLLGEYVGQLPSAPLRLLLDPA